MRSAWDIATAFVDHTEGIAGKRAAAALKKLLLQHVDYTRLNRDNKGIKLSHKTLKTPSSILVHVVIPGVCQQDVRIFKNGKLQVYRVKRTLAPFNGILAKNDAAIMIDAIVRDAMSKFPPPTTVNTAKYGKRMRGL